MAGEIKPKESGWRAWLKSAVWTVAKSAAASEVWKIGGPVVLGMIGAVAATIWGMAQQAPGPAIIAFGSVAFAVMMAIALMVQTYLRSRRQIEPPEVASPLDPTHDTPLGGAMVYLCLGTWNAPSEIDRLAASSVMEEKLKEVEQKAAYNGITIWGRHSGDLESPLVKVPPSHWAKHWIQPGTLRGRANTFVIPDQDGDQDASERFYDLKISRHQFEAAFPMEAGR